MSLIDDDRKEEDEGLYFVLCFSSSRLFVFCVHAYQLKALRPRVAS